MAFLLTAILVIVTGSLFMFYRSRCRQQNVFRSMGIPGPEPHWLLGNLREFYKRPSFENLVLWEKQYGKMFGYYEGPKPVLVTSDPQFLKEVFVRQFSKFHARKKFPLTPNPETFPDANILMAHGHRWKRLRTIVNPTFSTYKLRQVLPTIQKKIDVLVEKFIKAADEGKPIEVSDSYGKLTLDVIGETAFGMDIDSQNNPEEPFLLAAKKVFQGAGQAKRPFIFQLAAMVPEVDPFMAYIVRMLMVKLSLTPFMWLKATIHKVIEQRRKEKHPRQDFLQLMLDAESQNVELNANMWEMKETDNTEQEQMSAPAEPKQPMTKSQRKLTNAEIGNMSTVFFLAGYDTTSNLLTYLSYLLATNPEKQDTLLEEIDKSKDDTGEDTVMKMQYLDMCIKEALRMYPVAATVVNRMCMEETEVCGVRIPAGMNVQTNSMAMHYDQQLWGPVDTKLFHPERFVAAEVAARADCAWMPFGAGPRNCVGMRFALLEAKHAMVGVLRRLRFLPCPDTQIPLQLQEAATIVPEKGVTLRLERRP